jgi:hypothetical protein
VESEGRMFHKRICSSILQEYYKRERRETEEESETASHSSINDNTHRILKVDLFPVAYTSA